MRHSIAAVFLVLAGSAQAMTIDFQDGDPALIRTSQDPDACIPQLSVNHDGFNFDNPGNCGAYTQYFDGVSSDNLGLYFAAGPGQVGAGVTMTQLNGQDFDLLSLDVLQGATSFMQIFGYNDGLQTYSTSVNITGGFFMNEVLNWTGVDEVLFFQPWTRPNSIGIDNLVVNVVPIPAAVWLFGSALVGLGWLRRRQTA